MPTVVSWAASAGRNVGETGPIERVLEETPEIDFDSDEPLICPMGEDDGEPCEACQ